MDKIYLEQFLEQLVDKANVVIHTRETDSVGAYCLGNHYAAKWRIVLEEKFSCGHFKVSNITQRVSCGGLTWVVTIDHERDWVTDRLEQLSNCIIPGLDF